MIRLPSLVRQYDSYFSGDPALKQPPEPLDDATPEAVAEHEKALAEYVATLHACIDTGNWEPLIKPGEVPLKFILAPLDRITVRALVDRLTLPATNPRHIGDRVADALSFRMALIDIVGAEGIRIKREPDPLWDGWVMAQPEIVQILDHTNPRIVYEFGRAILHRAATPGKQ